MQGVETVQGFITGILGAFPDFQITVEDLIAEGDKVANRVTISGTFSGAFAGIPPTGQHATWTATGIYHIVGGKVVEVWEEVDMLGGFQRLGVIPALG
jgi:predicted ester cyclase